MSWIRDRSTDCRSFTPRRSLEDLEEGAAQCPQDRVQFIEWAYGVRDRTELCESRAFARGLGEPPTDRPECLPQQQLLVAWRGSCSASSGVKKVDVTTCSNATVLWAGATRARAALGSLDLFLLLRSLGEEGKRYSFSNPPSYCLSQI
jgi:hypothetical protein